jgi:MoaA/NifB/PqqE/SkfB family radical SAM enzyme
LTGGECLTYGKRLESVIRYAADKYLSVRIVTNGFWAKTYDKACQKIEQLVVAGLKEINFSTGDDHLEYVPIEYIENGILASLRFGLMTVVNVESNNDREFTSKLLLRDSKLQEFVKKGELLILNGIWIAFHESTANAINASLAKGQKYHIPNLERRCTNLFNTITIDPNHRVLACCGITVKHIKYMDLGDARKSSIKELYDRQFSDFLKIWIATDGTHKIMSFISKYTSVNDAYKQLHNCQVCAMLFNNDLYLKILQQRYREVYTNVVLKYMFNKKQYQQS